MITINYEVEYNRYYRRFYSLIEFRIKKYFVAQHEEKITFNLVYNKLHNTFFVGFGNDIFFKNNSDLIEIVITFNKGKDDYFEDYINLVCKNDCIPSFEGLNKELYPKKYTFLKLLIHIAFYNAKVEIGRMLRNNYNLFDLFYHHNEFDKFEIKDYSPINLEDTEIFIFYNKRKYPDLYIKHDKLILSEIKENSKNLDRAVQVLLIEKLIKHADKWKNASQNKKILVISKLIGRNADNIKDTLAMSNKKLSECTAKFIEDNTIADEIIKMLD